MKHTVFRSIIVLILVIGLVAVQASFSVHAAGPSETVTIDFPVQGLPFPNGTNITSEYSDQGILFSSDDSDLPPEYQKSLGWQENYIQANEGADGTFLNLFRLIFIATGTVTEVSVTLIDSNGNPQAHTLTAFDAAGNIVDMDSFTEDDLFPDPFILTVSSSGGIAYVVAIEQPYGAEILNRISYTIEREVKLDVSIDIIPRKDPNVFQCDKPDSLIPVAILTTDDFDATTVDHTTVQFEGAGEYHTNRFGVPKRHETDIDRDHDLDLLLHFRLGDTTLNCASTSGTLTGETFDGQMVQGSGPMSPVPPYYYTALSSDPKGTQIVFAAGLLSFGFLMGLTLVSGVPSPFKRRKDR